MSRGDAANGSATASGPNVVSPGDSADFITIPDAQLLFSGDFKRSGTDLILSDQAHEFVVHDYFRAEKRATLMSPDGATLSGAVVESLASHVQYAQAGATPGASAATSIGRVAKLDGNVTAIRNGVAVTLNVGDAVNKGDVIQTGSNSSISLSFADGTALNLSAGTRMALNEFVYDPGSNSNSGVFSLVQGGFAFVAGQVAKTGGLNIETPVATMGIRGTIGGGSCAEAGKCEFYAAPEFNGQASTYTLMTGGTFVNGVYVGGTVVGTVTVGANAILTATGANQPPQISFVPSAGADPALAALAAQLVLTYPQLFPTQPQQPNAPQSPSGGSSTPPPLDQPDTPETPQPLANVPTPPPAVVTLQNPTPDGPPVVVTIDFQPPPPPPPPPPVNQAPVVEVTIVTPDGYDMHGLYGDIANSSIGAHDATHFDAVNSGTGHTFHLVGSGFTYDGGGNITGGTITEIDILDTATGATLVTETGFAIDAVAMQSAVQALKNSSDPTQLSAILNQYSYNATGSAGLDTLPSFANADSFDGVGTLNTVDYIHFPSGITANLADPSQNTGNAAGDIYTNVNSLIGTNFNDTLIGDENNNALEGGAGADTLNGNGGALNFASYIHAPAVTPGIGVTADLGNTGNNTGDAVGDIYIGINSLIGSQFIDTLIGDDNANFLRGNGGADQLFGNDGSDTADYRFSFSVNGQGLVVDLSHPDNNTGAAFGDTYDSIENIRGSSFNDILKGDCGANVLTGLEGGDTFIYVSGADTVTDFDRGEGDKVDLTGVAGVHSFADITLTPSGVDDADTFIDFGGCNTLTLTGVTAADLVESDFVFNPEFTEYLSWRHEINPYAALKGSATKWVIPNSDNLTSTVFTGSGFTYDPVTGLPTGGTITSMSLVVDLDHTPLQTMTGFTTTLGELGTFVHNAETLRAQISWTDVIDTDNSEPLLFTDIEIKFANTDGTFTQILGSGFDQQGGLEGTVTELRHLAANGTDVLVALTGLSVSLALGAAAFGSNDAGQQLYLLAGQGANTLIGLHAQVGDTNYVYTNLDSTAGNDTIIGEPFSEGNQNPVGSVNYSDAPAAVQVDLATLPTGAVTGGSGNDTLSNISSVSGSDFNDTLAGNDDTNSLLGGEGNDSLFGAGGDDYLQGGRGADALDGGSDNDTAFYTSWDDSTEGVTADLSNPANNTGEAEGDTYFEIENLWGSGFADILKGDGYANVLTGSGGADTFKYVTGGGADTVADFDQSSGSFCHAEGDTIDLTGVAGIFTLDDVVSRAEQIDADTVIDFLNGDTLTLQNVTLEDLVESDFVFAANQAAPVLALNTSEYVEDRFDAQAYDLNTGSVNWAGGWVENENGDYSPSPTTGEIKVAHDPTTAAGDFQLLLSDDDDESDDPDTVERSADLSGATSATLTFDYRRDIPDGDSNNLFNVLISIDGTNFTTTLTSIGGGTFEDANYLQATFDISAYMSANTTIQFSVGDGVDDGDVVYVDNVKIDYVQSSTDYSASYVENGAATPIAIAGNSITDADNANMQSATITLTNHQADDQLAVNGCLPSGITASSYDSDTGVLMLSGEASRADYQAALHQIEFSNSGDNPGSTDRVITVTVYDGFSDSNVATSTIHVAPVNDAAVVDLDANDLTTGVGETGYVGQAYTDGNPVAIDVSAFLQDVDNTTLEGATISLTNAQNGDSLNAPDLSGTDLSADVTGGNGSPMVLTIIGHASIADYQTALEGITFQTDGNIGNDRTITVTVNDGTDDSVAATSTIHVSEPPANNAPVITVTSDNYPFWSNLWFQGLAGDQQATGVTYDNGHVYLVGNDPNSQPGATADAAAFVASFDAANPGIPEWQLNWDYGNFFGVAADGGQLYAAGQSLPSDGDLTSDGSGEEVKGLLTSFYADGSEGDNPAPAIGATPINFFPYDGVEYLNGAIATQQNDDTIIYAYGMAQPAANYGAYAVASFDDQGTLLHTATDPLSVPGFSIAHGAVFWNDNLWVAGSTWHASAGESTNVASVWQMSPNLATVTEFKDTFVAGGSNFYGAAVLNDTLYAVGTANSGNQYLVASYDANGLLLWSNSFVDDYGTGATALTGVVALSGRLFAVGYTTDAFGGSGRDAVLMELNPTNGNKLSESYWAGSLDEQYNAVATDGFNIFIAGESRNIVSGNNASGENEAVLSTFTIAPILVEAATDSNGFPISDIPSSSVTVNTSDADGDTVQFLFDDAWTTDEGNPDIHIRAMTYGQAEFDTTSGVLTYTLDNNDPNTDALTGGQQVTELVPVVATDGQAQTSQDVVFTIYGSNDAPVAYDETLAGDIAGFTYDSANGHWYKGSDIGDYQLWTDAQAIAVAAGGYLATITSSDENDFISSLIFPGIDQAWIGASDAAEEGVWRWAGGPEAGQQFWQGGAAPEGVALQYANWALDEPNNHFAAITPSDSGVWKALSSVTWELDSREYVTEVSIVEDVDSVIPSAFLLANDTDAEGQALSIDSVSATSAQNGTVTLLANGNVQYHSAQDYSGVDSFTYTVRDASGAVSNTATVTFTVAAVNDAPVLNTDGMVPTQILAATNFVTIDVPDALQTLALDINNLGQIVGQQNFGSYYIGWAELSADVFTDIVAPNTHTAHNTSANAINDLGVVAGFYEPNDSTPRFGFTWDDGNFSPPINFSPNISTTADGINNAGVFVGSSYLQNGNTFSGFIDDGGNVTYLNAFGSNNTHANGINDAGDVVGTYGTHGFLYHPNGSITADDFTTIDDPLGTMSTTVAAINNAGQIVGWYIDGSNQTHGFMYSDSVFTTIDDPYGVNGTFVHGINDIGQIVGSYLDDSNIQHGFVASVTPSTLISGLSVSDVDAGNDPLTVSLSTATGQLAPAGSTEGSDETLSFSGTLDAINAVLQDGAVYTPNALATGQVTLTVEDGFSGTDVTNFIFNQGPGAGVTLTGTPEKDVIFSTGGDDILTGDTSADTFIFKAFDNGSGPTIGDDVITDFQPDLDFLKVDQAIFADVQALLDAAQDDGNGNTVITDPIDNNNVITLNSVTIAQLNANSGHLLVG